MAEDAQVLTELQKNILHKSAVAQINGELDQQSLDELVKTLLNILPYSLKCFNDSPLFRLGQNDPKILDSTSKRLLDLAEERATDNKKHLRTFAIPYLVVFVERILIPVQGSEKISDQALKEHTLRAQNILEKIQTKRSNLYVVDNIKKLSTAITQPPFDARSLDIGNFGVFSPRATGR